MKPMSIQIPLFFLISVLGWSAAVAGLAFERDLVRVRGEIADHAVFNRGTCADYLDSGTRFLYQHGARAYLPASEAERALLRRRAPMLLRQLFELRLALLAQLRSFHSQGPVANRCVDGVRRALRYGRFVEENIAEFLVRGREADLPSLPLEGGEPSLMVNPAFASAALQTGDVFLDRSSNFVAAAIARIGDEDGQFGHLSMVHIDQEGRAWVMEAVMHIGVVIEPLQEWLEHRRTRLLVLRHEDAGLAARAAEEMYRWIREVNGRGEMIPYDYHMDESDRSELFCAELVGYAFERASGGRQRLPLWRTSLKALSGHSFLRTLEIRASDVFAPADAEIDPRLRLVAEWRDLRRTADMRIHDAILSSILDWMARYDYRMTYQGLRQGGVDYYWDRLRPEGVLANRVPSGMSREFVKAVVALYSVAALIHSRVKIALKTEPLGLDYKAVLAAVEEFRRRDCELAIEHRRWRKANPVAISDPDEPRAAGLHRLIRPPEGVQCPLPVIGGG